jgi:formylglycine-generating enzyme required for sulfatase activity
MNPSSHKSDNLPVENVSWDDVQDFIEKLNDRTGKTYRLPTEAEWEYAARGGNQSAGYIYSGGNTLDDVGWYYDNSDLKTHPIGMKKANELGIYDMSGNVDEWVNDYSGRYNSDPKSNPAGPASGSERVVRGGSATRDAEMARVFSRGGYNPSLSNPRLGFRLAITSK